MSTINQQNQKGDNIGKNKYVITIGTSEIKLANIIMIYCIKKKCMKETLATKFIIDWIK